MIILYQIISMMRWVIKDSYVNTFLINIAISIFLALLDNFIVACDLAHLSFSSDET